MKLRHVAVLLAVAASVTLGIAAPAGAASPRTEHFLLLSTNPDATRNPIIARGPIHARGTDVQVNDNIDRFVFPDGALRIRHTTNAKSSKDTFDPATCYGTHTERGTYTVVRGTRAYHGASGHGHYRLKIQFVGCSQSAPPKVFILQIKASGPLNLP